MLQVEQACSKKQKWPLSFKKEEGKNENVARQKDRLCFDITKTA